MYLTGNNTYSGGTTICDGTLYVGYWTASGTLGSGPVTNYGTLAFLRTGSATVGNAISGSGSLVLEYGTVTLTGANTYSGGTTIHPYATLRVGGTQGTLGSGDVTGDDGYGGSGELADLVFDRDAGLTVGNNITGSLHVRQQGGGAIVLTGTNTYSGGTTVAAGSTLRVGNGGTAGTVGPGEIVIEQGAELAFDRSDSFTLENTLSGSGVLNQDGSGTLVFTGAGSVGGVTIGSGTMRVEGLLTSEAPLVNEGTLRVVGAGAFTHAGRRIAGSAAALSAGEVFLTSTGLGSASVSFDFEISTDGATWYPIAEGGAADSQAMLSGLEPETDYYLRGRAAHPGGGQEIYDGGMVSTGLRPGPGVPDTSGWYRIVRFTRDADGSRLLPEDPSTAYVDRRVLPQATDEALRAVDAEVHVFGDPATPPPGSDFIFNLDRSWFFAGSPQAAVLQALVGLVTDGTSPTVVDGVIKLWHVWHVAAGQTIYDLWTFDAGRYPDGGYSGVYHFEDSYTGEIEQLETSTGCQSDECCDASGGGAAAPSILDGTGVACGAPTNTGGAKMAMPAIHHTGGASACTGVGGGLTYASRETSLDTGFGPGWSDADELPYLSGGSQNVMVRLGSEQSVWFDALPGGAYAARYGAKDTLLHDAVNHLFIFTRPGGERGEFFDFDQTDRPQGGLYRLIQPGGATIEVTGWTEEGIDGRIAEVLDKITPTGQAHQKRAFTYVATDDGREHVQTLTLLAYDQSASSWIDVRRLSYAYYVADADYGLPGDLKKIVTQRWDTDGEQWIGDDTNYFRYYTAAGMAHQLKRVLIPNAYAAFVSTYGDPDDPQNPNAGDGQSDPIANYTCFYYEYDADHRVTSRLVFGKSNETDYTVTLSRNSRQTNYWHRKTVETRPDGSTHTVYANHLGQPILTDLYDPAEQVHVITYNRYDGDGRLLLAVESSAFVFYGGGYYDEDLPDLVGFGTGDSPYLSNTDGLFHVTTYYDSTSQGIDEETAGGVEGFRYQTAVAQGEDAARLAPGAQGGPILLSSWTYYARAVGGTAIYPLAASTVYANENGSGAITTTHAYTWYADSFQAQQQTTTLPAVPVEQNGSGTSATRRQWFDDRGNLAWTMDELGRVTWYGYDSLTGRMARSIEDIDDDAADQLQLTPPAGWTLPASGANRTTDYRYDPFGRLTQMLGPAHTALVDGAPAEVRTARWTFYNDAAHQTRSAQGYAEYKSQSAQWDLFTILGPISIIKTDRDGRTTERIQAVYSGTLAALSAATIPQSDYTAWTTNQYSKTRPASTRVYHDIPASGTGSAGINYLQTTYGYETFGTDKKGRQNRTVVADGTITRVVFDARGNVLETWMGTGATDADPTGGAAQGNNMLLVSSATFDTAGNLLESRAHFDSGANDYYATLYQYDWRNRRTDIRSPLLAGEGQGGGVVTHAEYDNLGRQLWTRTYASADFTLSATELRAQSQNVYDSRGRVYESRLYAVDPGDGTVGAYLPSYTWYDARGQVVKAASANGLFHKYQYDRLRRVVATYTSFDLDEEDYADALDVSGDTVIEQTRAWYDAAGQTVATATYRRLPDDTTTTGALTAATSYATAAVLWYDGLGRTIATADYGREDVGSGLTHYFFDGTTGALIDADENGIPDIAEAAPPEPYPQDPYSLAGIDFQLQLIEYNGAGRAYRTIDNLGRITQTDQDAAGRTIRTIQNYDDGQVDETDTDQDVTVEYQYDSGGRLVTLTAYNPKGSGNGVQAQATKYLYESPINAAWQTAAVYPDSDDVLTQNGTTKVWTITTDNGDRVSTDHDRLGRTIATTDQRGMVHDYTFDTAGRLAADIVTDLGSSGLVDASVRRIGRTYDDIGRQKTLTSYSDTSGTTVVNQVQYEYNGWGRLGREYQAHDGAVDLYTPYVDYLYDDGASGGIAKYVRLSQVTYPDGREVRYDYGTTQAIDDIMSRLATIGDASSTYASYNYLGGGRIVTEDYEDIQVQLDYTADDFAALDRFGRVLDQVWTDYGADPDVVVDHHSYTYDRAGNRTSRTNQLNHDLDELYDYDPINRLISSTRADDFDQSWTLDGLGNFSEFDDDGQTQTRTANAVNEITAITGGWITPSYDAAGNMTSGPKPGDETTRVHYRYDAWNRLVAVHADDPQNPGQPEHLLATYEYDGAKRRIEKTVTQSGGGPTHAHYFYNHEWRLLEERLVDDQDDLVASNQYVWSPRYIDAPIVRFHDSNGDGDLLDPEDNIRYYTGDANYNVTATLDAATGEVLERYVYTAYGTATVYSPTWTDPAAPTTDAPLYAGYFFDAETALYQVRNRYYDASLSAFISRDPIGYQGKDVNLCRYVYSSPTNATDASGLSIQPGRIIGPPDALSTAELGVLASNQLVTMAFDRNTPWLEWISAQILISLQDPISHALSDISSTFWAGVNTDAGNRFVFTCKCGWLDMGHFWASALAGYKMGAVDAYAGGIMVEFHQQGWPWGSWHDSAWTAEDLVSDWKGAQFGESLQGKSVFDILPAFKELLKDCNAVPYNPQTSGILEQEAIDWSGRTLPPGMSPFDKGVPELPVDPGKLERMDRMEDPQPRRGNACRRLCDRDWTTQW